MATILLHVTENSCSLFCLWAIDERFLNGWKHQACYWVTSSIHPKSGYTIFSLLLFCRWENRSVERLDNLDKTPQIRNGISGINITWFEVICSCSKALGVLTEPVIYKADFLWGRCLHLCSYGWGSWGTRQSILLPQIAQMESGGVRIWVTLSLV